ncbi:DNA-directed RNA polymerases I, II, and III subunit RPABC1 [Sphaceloma murrayae]|uniref:DNA-directed RNA polymerases I, II, and III subunit RPABC1 n=1 Tax=Sphaceloma murrayae TaxID=2082308 RepID=A0A2K1QRJ1_9PEZI|nr:DNA-directed RNA polymerases I, II, and III subunit RPABC1 [Sphaceloma murrayae]
MADEESRRELSRMWRIWKTTKQMLYDRGYELTEEECNLSLKDFESLACDNNGQLNKPKLNFSARPTETLNAKYTSLPTKAAPDGGAPQIGTIYVEFSTDSAVGIKHLRTFASFLNERNFYSGVFITGASITSSALKSAANLPIAMEVWPEQDLLVNITRHELVPKHILLTPTEKKALLERYRLKETQLPRIRMEDPVAKYLGLRRGQVVKIIRKSETAGRYASYRWVI